MKRFNSGARVPASGIYEVLHSAHRLMHQVTILKGEVFPKCKKCGTAVRFRMAMAVAERGWQARPRFSDLLIPYGSAAPRAAKDSA